MRWLLITMTWQCLCEFWSCSKTNPRNHDEVVSDYYDSATDELEGLTAFFSSDIGASGPVVEA